MNNPAASGRGIESDLLMGHTPHCRFMIPPQGDGESTPTRLKHEFYCLNEGKFNYANYQSYDKKDSQVTIHDDLIRYINDTLMWVPCIHLSGNHYKETYGLSLYGATVINQDGASMLTHVLSSWENLFSKAPTNFELNGGVTVKSDGTVGDFHKIRVERDEFLNHLNILINYANKTLKEEYFILHFGI
jgi:hypothetical protein